VVVTVEVETVDMAEEKETEEEEIKELNHSNKC